MEITRDVEDAMQQSRPTNGFAVQNNTSRFRCQGGGVVARTKSFKNNQNVSIPSSAGSNARLKVPIFTQG